MEWLARPGIQGGLVQERWEIREGERCVPEKGKVLPSPKMDNKIINKIIVYLLFVSSVKRRAEILETWGTRI